MNHYRSAKNQASLNTSALLLTINDMLGKDVTVTGRDGSKYTGILTACSPEMDLGLSFAYKITESNQRNLLPKRSEIEDKMQFHFSDIVGVSACATEEKPGTRAMGFATDRDYHGTNDDLDDPDFEEWNADEDEGVGGSIEEHENSNDLPDQRNRRGNGWSVDEMFKVNEKLNVKSTFKEDLTQYTTVGVEGTEEDRRRADQLAREIEQNQSSKFYAKLENDDVERDLDKETGEDDFEAVGSNNRRGNNNSGYNQQQNRRSNNMAPNGQPINRRADGLKSSTDRRNSGVPGNQNRHNQQGYSQSSGSSKNMNNSYNNRRQGSHEEYQNDWQMSKGKKSNAGNNSTNNSIVDGSSAPNNQKFQKQMLESRNSQRQPTESEKQGSRVADLKHWNKEYPIMLNAEEKEPVAASTSTSSAWNHGPPSSLVSNAKANAAPSVTSTTQSSPSTSASNVDQQVRQKSAKTDDTESASTSATSGVISGSDDKNENKSSDGNENALGHTDTSDTSSNAEGTNKVASFKFNVNAPEFKPRFPPSTPTAPIAVIPAQQQQFASEQFVAAHPQQIHTPNAQQAAIQMQGQPIIPAQSIVPQMQVQHVMWPQHAQQYSPYPMVPQQIQAMPIHRGQAQNGAQIYGAPIASNANAVPAQAAQAYYPPNQYAGQMHGGQYQQIPATQGQMIVGPAGAQSGAPTAAFTQQAGQQRYSQQVYMIQPQQGQRFQGPPPSHEQQQYANQQQQQGAPQSHPNSQPPTPGPQQSGQQQQQPQQQQQQNLQQQNSQQQQSQQQPPSQAQSVASSAPAGGMRQGTDTGSSGSLSGSAASQSGAQQQRSVSPNPQGVPQPSVLQPNVVGIPPPHQPTQQAPVHYMQMPIAAHPAHPSQHYYQQACLDIIQCCRNCLLICSLLMFKSWPVYYQASMMYQQPHMQMAQHGAMGQVIPSDNNMDPNMMQPYLDNYGNYVQGYYGPPQQHQQHGGPMSRQNSLPQYQQQPQHPQQPQTQGNNSNAPPPQQQQQQQSGVAQSQGQ
ncbi:unnamed protein product [Caenorhabditis bovis]|uniref:LsmAD domain-containing protein n=1 Tax=Caenorhabditis bovis TaxID=2654633 RepID=A0A8S1ER84_9PELO|nr:unnamed protein product [Caenorhabditis bovis]